jgi:hypothetical protein
MKLVFCKYIYIYLFFFYKIGKCNKSYCKIYLNREAKNSYISQFSHNL